MRTQSSCVCYIFFIIFVMIGKLSLILPSIRLFQVYNTVFSMGTICVLALWFSHLTKLKIYSVWTAALTLYSPALFLSDCLRYIFHINKSYRTPRTLPLSLFHLTDNLLIHPCSCMSEFLPFSLSVSLCFSLSLSVSVSVPLSLPLSLLFSVQVTVIKYPDSNSGRKGLF